MAQDEQTPQTKVSSNPRPNLRPGHGVLVRAANGDVIRYDPSGLVMRLSDTVIRDIALRLAEQERGGGQVPVSAPSDAGQGAPRSSGEQVAHSDPQTLLDTIDAWDLREHGEWLLFNARLPGRQGVRAFRRLREGGHILADAPGPLFGILGLGGPRAALATGRACAFPQHVVAPADDIGAVGHGGEEGAREVDRLEHLREMTHEALMAETLLEWQLEKHEALPLFCTRVETDSSASIQELANGTAYESFLTAARNLAQAAARLGRKAQLFCVTLDFALEDVQSSAAQYRDGVLGLMAKAERDLLALGFDAPVFVARLESGTAQIREAASIEGQWELGWNHGDHKFVYSAPAYMFEQDSFARPTVAARTRMAEMSALAVSQADEWRCPTLYLAERDGTDPTLVRVIARAMTPLVIDSSDPFGAGAMAGFRLLGAKNGAEIVEVALDPGDPHGILLRLSAPPEGEDLQVAYAYGAPERVAEDGGYCANCGALRDDWQGESATGSALHRWALPCVLPLTAGGLADA